MTKSEVTRARIEEALDRILNKATTIVPYSLHVPAHSDHPFRFNPITDFGLIRSPISELSDQK